jgi:hypothetical protein
MQYDNCDTANLFWLAVFHLSTFEELLFTSCKYENCDAEVEWIHSKE